MSKRKWHKGPPPHIGWWNASASRSSDAWRWWNGHSWSQVSRPDFSAQLAAHSAAHLCSYGEDVEWTDYWPANARVPRVDPRHA